MLPVVELRLPSIGLPNPFSVVFIFDIDLSVYTSGQFTYSHEINLFSYSYIAFQTILAVPIVEVITFDINAGFYWLSPGFWDGENSRHLAIPE